MRASFFSKENVNLSVPYYRGPLDMLFFHCEMRRIRGDFIEYYLKYLLQPACLSVYLSICGSICGSVHLSED